MKSCGTRCWITHTCTNAHVSMRLSIIWSWRIDRPSCRRVNRQLHILSPVWRWKTGASTHVPDPTSTEVKCITGPSQWRWMFSQAVRHNCLIGDHVCWSHCESDVPVPLLCRTIRAAGDTFAARKWCISCGFRSVLCDSLAVDHCKLDHKTSKFLFLGSALVIDCRAVMYSEFDEVFWLSGDSFVDTDESLPVYYNYTR